MQPSAAIPPYVEAEVMKLKGVRCAVPQLTNPSKRWWVTIQEVKYVSLKGVAVRVAATVAKFGNARWVSLQDCRWRGHIDDPLAQQIAKARGERSKKCTHQP